MSSSVLDLVDISTLTYIITHVFCPLQLPNGDDRHVDNNRSLAGAIASVAHRYSDYAIQANIPQWDSILRMLNNLRTIVRFQSLDKSKTISQLSSMDVGDICAFLIRAQNASIIIRKQRDVTVFESFEASPMAKDVMSTQGKLVCSYPGPAIEIPNATFEDKGFLSELANFLVRMNDDILPDAVPTTRKAQSTVLEVRETIHPRYITELLTGILRSIGHPVEVVRICKRVGDDVVWNNSELPWRRSPLWLLIRIVLQTTLDRSTLKRTAYKEFMLYFMCSLGKEKLCEDLSNDLLHFMSAKISRRLQKLGPSAPEWLSSTVLETCTSLSSILSKRWKQVQATPHTSPLWNPSQLDLEKDAQLLLLDSGDYIRSRLIDNSVGSPDKSFSPSHHPRGGLDDFLSLGGAFFREASRIDPHVTLYDVEQEVAQGIDAWVDRAVDNDQACVELEMLTSKYSSAGLKTNTGNPESLSIMLLTVVELWVALDKIAVRANPMLADYSPEVPVNLLEGLLLCRAGNLERLRRAHQYLSHRHFRSKHGWSVFSRKVTENAFAVRYYRRSSHLQHLKAQIEEVAQREVRDKIDELEDANVRYAELEQQATEIDHSFDVDRNGIECHSSNCRKCNLESEQIMWIEVHEWPLPADQLHAEVVVFELDCPVSFNMWRSITSHLLLDLGSLPFESKDPHTRLDHYHALRPYLVQHAQSRVTLGSDTKPFAKSHYGKVSIPATREKVCVNNGLAFYAFDTRCRIPVSMALGHIDIRKYCVYRIQGGPYHQLQKYVDDTSHTPNEVVANQAHCHIDLSIREFMAFGHLRSGGMLQWFNILRELRGRSLSFRHYEVHFLLSQATSQTGPLENEELVWHTEIQQPDFCNALLDELENLVQDVETNWLEGVTMDTVSLLLRRLLASRPNQAVSLRAIKLLRTVRNRVFAWVLTLSNKLTKAQGGEEFRGFLRDSAAICRSTFDVSPAKIHSLLNSAEDVDILLFSSMIIHDHTPSKVSSLPVHSQLLLDRDRRLSLALHNAVTNLIQADSGSHGVDLAITRTWHGYRPGSEWVPLPNPNSRWISCTTAETTTESSQMVHFNLFDGSLLVDGKPIGRLPTKIVQHPLYGLIFGEQVLEAIASDLPGSDYMTKGTISEHQVYFSLRNADLVIRVKRVTPNDSEILELMSQEKLGEDLPAVFVEGHVHWLNICTSVMEIRPLDRIWETSLENWKIDCTLGQYRMYKGHEVLVDIRSQSWIMVSNLLKPLDTSRNLIISIRPIDPSRLSSTLQLSADLPRYGLSFYVDEDGELHSCNIRDMVYDENQSIGTLFGLVNRLVLRPKTIEVKVATEFIRRCVIIPMGNVSFLKDDHHVRVEVNTRCSALEPVTYQTYRIDTDLGCLATTSLTNKLYCAYLHALTNGCGVDPLTGKLGTEEALSLLWSASCWSIMKFSPCDAELLSLIASMCPPRTWYPTHLMYMQKVKWLDLPASSQRHELYHVAKEIKAHYERLQFFHENLSKFYTFPSMDDHLLWRSARRTVHLSTPDVSCQPYDTNCDVHYTSRDLVECSSGEHRAYTAATTVHHRRAVSATTTRDILSMVKSWTGIVHGDTTLSLQYSRSWLAPSLPQVFIKAYNLLRGDSEKKWFRLLFSLPAMAYASQELSGMVPMFVAFASDPRFYSEDPPSYDSYDISKGYKPSETILRNYVSCSAHQFRLSPESSEPARGKETPRELRQRRARAYHARVNSDVDATVCQLLSHWPCETPPRCSLDHKLYDVASFTSSVGSYFTSCFRNLELREHLTRVQLILEKVVLTQALPSLQYSFDPSQATPSHISWTVTMDQLFSRLAAPSLRTHDRLPQYTADVENAPLSGSLPLNRLIAIVDANAASHPFQQQYISALRTSAEHFGGGVSQLTGLPSTETLVAHCDRCKTNYTEELRRLRRHLGPISQSEQALEQSGQWPRITTHVLLQLLSSNSPITLSDSWKGCLVQLSLLALALQRARRLLRLHLDNQLEELSRELQNEGCDGWDAEMHPDWLLVQLQSNFFIRRVQAEVANEMISPCSGDNTAMQLNMGEGKSSVIVPIVAAALANGDQLVRVIVPKALTAQMFQLLVKSLSGLTNRRIYFLPFSRSSKIDCQKVDALRDIMYECIKERGILVIQPEHILSLKLVSVEKQLFQTNDTQVAAQLLELQRWFHSCSRDILDESDEILHVRYQLVYTIGEQQPMEGFPERWTTTQQILSLVKERAAFLRQHFPLGVEYEDRLGGSFPHFRILHTNDAGQTLISWIVQDIIDGLIPNFNFGQFSFDLKDAIRNFILCQDVSPRKAQLVEEYTRNTPLWGGLLLLRGLLANGILLFAFKERRWRVDYGLALVRTMFAVPYRAKDIPAQKAEFGHPDVAIVLTCLSYYYAGLTEEQLKASFKLLLKQDDPSADYDLWLRECSSLPKSLRTLSGINIDSCEQWCCHLVPAFLRNKATIDFYLSRVVFPKGAKEFPSKLSCSGWDLAEKRERLLTGFSGTNDGQYLFPLHISQRDPDHQRGTNAKVLSYLLRPENKDYMSVAGENGERRTATEFLKILHRQKPEIRVLLDVGAQMLDLSNYYLAKAWLDINSDASAAIYFNEDDELTVLERDGRTQHLLSSPFAHQLDQCVAYLDDAHTRGTDIKFPSGFRAAVTLGPKVTKDRLVQGCMRIRKLGHGHSVMFFAPFEVDLRVRSLASKGPLDNIDTVDILHWAIRETWDDIQQRAPHWAQQGMDHTLRRVAWSDFCKNKLASQELADQWLQPEAKRLEELYGPRDTASLSLEAAPEIRQRCEELGISSLSSASVDEEQEREVLHEAEHERQVERPPRAPPATHSVHPDIVAFVKTGIVPSNTEALHPVFETLDETLAASNEPHIWSSSVLATTDFQNTVTSPPEGVESYLRPVQWVVSGKRPRNEVLVILSPHEVTYLLPSIRSSSYVHLHPFTPRVTKSMKPCDDLVLYSIPKVTTGWTAPPLLMDQLNVFAGQLYLKDYKTYIRLCHFLCVYTRDLGEEIRVGCDGFVAPEDRPRHLQNVYTFQSTPILALKNLMNLRRQGMCYALTHMGKLLSGRLLSEDDFDDCDNTNSKQR